jgi:hypothetical protein
MVMSEEQGLELKDDIQHHERAWKLKRIAWYIMAIIVLLAILGFIGGGETSERTYVSKHLTVSYQKMAHTASPTVFEVTLDPQSSDTVMVRFENNYFKRMEIEGIIPEPVSSASSEGMVSYFFLNKDKSKAIEIEFLIRADKFGCYDFAVSCDNDRLHLSQFIFP